MSASCERSKWRSLDLRVRRRGVCIRQRTSLVLLFLSPTSFSSDFPCDGRTVCEGTPSMWEERERGVARLT